MNFQSPKRMNPFDNFIVGVLMHAVALGIAVWAVVQAIAGAALWPLIVGGLAVAAMEGAWLYFRLRR